MGNTHNSDPYKSDDLSDDVVAYLAEQMPKESECEQNTSYDKVGGHTYYEGYFHAVNDKDTVCSVHPVYGVEVDKAPASERLVKFIHAFQDLNKPWMDKFYKQLPHDKIGDIFRKWIDNRWHFADIAIQIHHGTQVSGDNIFWHSDTVNSLLHMAITINGDRCLHTKTNKFPQHKNNVYVSSPWSFIHGVTYEECDQANKIIAVQCRFLMTQQDWMDISEYL